MAEVRVPLKVEDQATPAVDKYIQKMTAAATTTQRLTKAMTASEILARVHRKEVENANRRYQEWAESNQTVAEAAERFANGEEAVNEEVKKTTEQLTREEIAQNRLIASRERAAAATAQAERMTISAEIAKNRLSESESRAAKVSAQAELAQLRNQQAQERAAAAHKKAARAAEQQEKKTNKLLGTLKAIGSSAKSAVSGLLGFGKVGTPLDGVVSKLTRMAASLFTVRKLIKYMKDAMERAPDEIASSFTSLGTTIKNDFATVFVTMLKAIQPGIDKLRASLESPGGQRFLKGIARAAEVAGQAIGWMAEMVGVLIEWIGNNWNVIMPVAIGLLGLFAAKMLVAAAASAAANWQLLLIVGAVAGVITVLAQLGVTASDVFGFIGGLLFWLGALFNNFGTLVENVCSAIDAGWSALTYDLALWADNAAKDISASFHDMVADIFDDLNQLLDFISSLPGVGPMGSIKKAFEANGVDFGAAFSGVASAARSQAAAERAGKNESYIDVGAAFEAGWNKSGKTAFEEGWSERAWAEGEAAGREFGKTIDDFLKGWDPNELDNRQLQDIKAAVDDISGAGGLGGIGASVENIEKAVAMSEEDIKHIADIAERRYVNKINLTSQTPVINITGQNTGRMQDDAINLANMIAKVLMEQASASATRATALP